MLNYDCPNLLANVDRALDNQPEPLVAHLLETGASMGDACRLFAWPRHTVEPYTDASLWRVLGLFCRAVMPWTWVPDSPEINRAEAILLAHPPKDCHSGLNIFLMIEFKRRLLVWFTDCTVDMAETIHVSMLRELVLERKAIPKIAEMALRRGIRLDRDHKAGLDFNTNTILIAQTLRCDDLLPAETRDERYLRERPIYFNDDTIRAAVVVHAGNQAPWKIRSVRA